jgi:nitric oxide reductase large subunit
MVAADTSEADERLKLWLKVWAPIFMAGGAGFYLLPGRITSNMNKGARLVGMEESPVDADNLWVVLAMAYMALITTISARAALTDDRERRRELTRLLMVGKTASSFGALGYFIFKRRAYSFLANFLIDGAILGVTYRLLEATEPD